MIVDRYEPKSGEDDAEYWEVAVCRIGCQVVTGGGSVGGFLRGLLIGMNQSKERMMLNVGK
jgi:hypothetical protein